ncbi:MAG TPA: thioredoxin family protein [Burkholderiales bacterium]|nr:thioredoxin family protein [Burkholderiales bacterium]
MASLQSSPLDLNFHAPDFNLLGVDGKHYTLQDVRGENGLLVVFICNHCPYVKAIRERLVRDTRELLSHGVGSVAIMSNDAVDYPEDSFDNMRKVAKEFGFPFPYLHDETQAIAKAYGAVCTPDFFGFNRDLQLRYRGRLDESGRASVPNARRELFEGMLHVTHTGEAPVNQTPSIGCSIKWRA